MMEFQLDICTGILWWRGGSANQSYQPSHRGINHRGIGTMFDIATISHLPAIDSTDFL